MYLTDSRLIICLKELISFQQFNERLHQQTVVVYLSVQIENTIN